MVICYANFGYVLFHAVSYSFSDYWLTIHSVMGYVTGAVDFTEFESAVPLLGALFIILVPFTITGLIMAYVSSLI